MMAETKMPAAEAVAALAHDDERVSYELAFHVLPTVAEGEVSGAFESLKAHITKSGGEFFDEEAPQRIDLAYDIEKPIDGKNRRFHSAYFGWVRFRLEGGKLPHLVEEIDLMQELLRTLVIKLTKVEEAHPFRYHEVIREKDKKVRTVEDKEVLVEAVVEEATAEVSEKAHNETIAPGVEGTDAAEVKGEATEAK